MVSLDVALKEALRCLCAEEDSSAFYASNDAALCGSPTSDKLTPAFCQLLLLEDAIQLETMSEGVTCQRKVVSADDSSASVPLLTEVREIPTGERQPPTVATAARSKNDVTADGSQRYPAYPLVNRLAQRLTQWLECGVCPLVNSPSLHLLEETKPLLHQAHIVHNVQRCLADARDLWREMSFIEQTSLLRRVVTCLGVWGTLQLLGVRRTAGSVPVLPPPRSELHASFTALHKPPSKLTVGARALAKHCHRDGNTFWGAFTGKEAEKNQQAELVFCKILDDVCWMNIHLLPHDISVLEVRQRDGYGARWLSNGCEFRGFLEPQMEDGHSVHWRHAPQEN